MAALRSRSPSSNPSNAPLFPGFFAPWLYRCRQVRACCFIRVLLAHYLDKHSPYFQAGFGLMVSKNSAKHAYICGMPIQPQQTGRGRRHNCPPSRRGPCLGRAPQASPRDPRNQQQGPRLRLVSRVARAPPTHDAPSSLGTLAPAQRRDGIRATQKRQRRCAI